YPCLGNIRVLKPMLASGFVAGYGQAGGVMLTDDEITALFRDTESESAERKRNFQSAADRIRQAICAFANDLPNHRKPGVVFIGQEDDGRCAGITVDDDLLKTLGGLRS